MLRHLVPPAVALVIAAVVFTVVERRWPALRKASSWRRPGSLLDVAYWFFNPLVSKPLTRVATLVAVVPIAVAHGAPLHDGKLQGWLDARSTIVSFQPAW